MRLLPDFLCASGAALFLAGLWLVYAPLALLAAGALLLSLGVVLYRRRP